MNAKFLTLLALLLATVSGCTTVVLPKREPAEPDNSTVIVNEGPPMNTGELDNGADGAGEGHPMLGWQQSGTLVTGDFQRSFSMQKDFSPFAGVFTIQLGVIAPQSSPGVPSGFEAIADVSWSVAGSTIRRRISVGNGVEISSPAQAVNVVVHDRSDPLLAVAGLEYVVFVQATPGSRASVGQPPTLNAFSQNQPVPAASGLVVPLPPDAGVISVEASILTVNPGVALAPNTIGLFMHGLGGVTVKSFDITDAAPQFVAVPPNVTDIEIHNFGAVGINANISWGIDG